KPIAMSSSSRPSSPAATACCPARSWAWRARRTEAASEQHDLVGQFIDIVGSTRRMACQHAPDHADRLDQPVPQAVLARGRKQWLDDPAPGLLIDLSVDAGIGDDLGITFLQSD